MKNQKYSAKTAEKGQAIILVAFMMIGLIAMLGLVIDGGGLMYLQRDVQNAVDDAIVAATYAKCVNGNVNAAAVNAAQRSGYEHGVNGVQVVVNNPPLTGPGAGNSQYVEVTIIAGKTPYFIHIVHSDPLMVTSSGVGRCIPTTTTTAANGRALFANSTTCDNGGTLKSTGATRDIIGGIHSNHTILDTGSSHSIQGDASFVTSANSASVVTPGPIQQTGVMSMPGNFQLADYDIGGKYQIMAGARYIKYTSAVELGAAELGAYDLIYSTTDISIDGRVNGTFTTTIVSAGNINMQKGNGKDITLNAKFDHLLLFANNYGTPSCAAQSIKVSASSVGWTGILYAPNGEVKMSMATGSTYNGAIWANSIDISGSSTTIYFDTSWLPPVVVPPKIAIVE